MIRWRSINYARVFLQYVVPIVALLGLWRGVLVGPASQGREIVLMVILSVYTATMLRMGHSMDSMTEDFRTLAEMVTKQHKVIDRLKERAK